MTLRGLTQKAAICVMLAAPAGPLVAQQIVIETLEIEPLGFEPLDVPEVVLGDVTSETVSEAVIGTGALLRGLDKLTGEVADFDLDNGFSVNFGDLRVDMAQCRHPAESPNGEAFAFVSIFMDKGAGENVFQGWMIASSPALNALDHARYDVWVLRCKTSEAVGTE